MCALYTVKKWSNELLLKMCYSDLIIFAQRLGKWEDNEGWFHTAENMHAASAKVVHFDIVHNRSSKFQQQYTTQYISHLQSLTLPIPQYTNNENSYFYFTSSIFETQIPFEAAIAICSSTLTVLLSWRIVAAKRGRDVTVLKE
jgi:hypothetical protein